MKFHSLLILKKNSIQKIKSYQHKKSSSILTALFYTHNSVGADAYIRPRVGVGIDPYDASEDIRLFNYTNKKEQLIWAALVFYHTHGIIRYFTLFLYSE